MIIDKNSSIDLRRAFTSASVDRSSISSASVTAGLFPNLSCLVSLMCSLLTEVFSMHEVCLFLFFDKAMLFSYLPRGRWRPGWVAMSMVSQWSVGGACGWLVSAVFWAWTEKKLLFPWLFSKRKMKCVCTFHSRVPATFQSPRRYRALALSPSQKDRWPNSIFDRSQSFEDRAPCFFFVLCTLQLCHGQCFSSIFSSADVSWLNETEKKSPNCWSTVIKGTTNTKVSKAK